MRSLRCKRLSSSTGFFPDCQFFQAHSVYITPAITSRTGRNCAELCLRFFLISIHFPVTGALECPRPVLDKAFDIIRRITEKQANLMREFMGLTQAQRQLCEPPLRVPCRIMCSGKNRLRFLTGKISLQPFRAVHIDQRVPILLPQRQKSYTARQKLSVGRADLFCKFLFGIVRAGKKAGSLNPCQCRRTIPYQHFFGHLLPPFTSFFEIYCQISAFPALRHDSSASSSGSLLAIAVSTTCTPEAPASSRHESIHSPVPQP